jgi:limonene 1,2-monooxygenase
MVLLDHLTRGRIMFGVGPGALPSDAHMMGIDPATQRERMEESLGAIIALLTADEPVSLQTDWFTLRDARLQLRPYTYPHFEIAVAATVSPAGPRTAGHYGVGLLSLGATSMGGFAVLGDHWKIWNDQARAFGHQVDRSTWRLVGPMHVAPTRKQAFEEVEYGIHEWIDYFRNVVALPLAPEEPDPRKWPQALVDSGTAVIGSPDDAAAQLAVAREQQSGTSQTLGSSHDAPIGGRVRREIAGGESRPQRMSLGERDAEALAGQRVDVTGGVANQSERPAHHAGRTLQERTAATIA